VKTEFSTFRKRVGSAVQRALTAAAVCACVLYASVAEADTILAPDIADPTDNKYEALVSSVLGTHTDEACRAPEAPDKELSQFWKTTLALGCAQKDCSSFVYTPQNHQRIESLMPNASDKILMDAIAKYASLKNVEMQDFLSDTVEQIFSNSELSSNEQLKIYHTLVPLLEHHAFESGDAVWFKKLQSIRRTLNQYINKNAVIRCTYTEDAQNLIRLSLPVTTWALGTPFYPRYETVSEQNVELSGSNLVCEIDYVPETFIEAGQACAQSLSLLKTALDDLHFALRVQDQDSIDATSDALILSLHRTREEMGWASGFNTKWSSNDRTDVACRLYTVSLQLLSQDRMVMAMRLDEAAKGLIPGYNFYARLSSNEKCMARLNKTYKETLSLAYEEHVDAYRWVVQNFSADKRKKLDKAFASWTKKLKPAPARFRRLVASFTALSLGDFTRAAQFSEGIELKLNRANNPQIFGYDLVMQYLRGTAPEDSELLSRLNDMAQKSASHMFSSLSAAHGFMSAAQKKAAFKTVSNFSVALAPQSAAIFAAKYWTEISVLLNQTNMLRTGVWALNQAWYAWTPAMRASVAKQLVSKCAELNDESCVREAMAKFGE